MGARCVGHVRITWSAVYSAAPHSHFDVGARPHLCMDDRKHPTPVLEALRKKLTTRVALLRRLAGSGWGAGAKTLRIATLSLIYSTAEYCAPVWCRSTHTRLIDSVLNDALPLSLVACVQLQRTVYLCLQASSRLSYADRERHSPLPIVAAWTQTTFFMNCWLCS